MYLDQGYQSDVFRIMHMAIKLLMQFQGTFAPGSARFGSPPADGVYCNVILRAHSKPLELSQSRGLKHFLGNMTDARDIG